MLLAGAIADLVGSRTINLAGTFVLGVFILASGFARTVIQLITFRVLQGLGVAMCFPTAVSILSSACPKGKIRNVSFACLGLGTPFGFSVGILLGGFFESTIVGWKLGFFLSSGITMTLFVMEFWCLPPDSQKEANIWPKMKSQIDWIGILISSLSLGLMSYIFALVLL